MPRKVLRALDRRRDIVAIDVSDFGMTLDVWIIYGGALGNLTTAVDVLVEAVEGRLQESA